MVFFCNKFGDIKCFKFPAFLGNDVLLNENYLYFLYDIN